MLKKEVETINSLQYKIALSLIPGIGNILARRLIAYMQGLDEFFNCKKKDLLKVPGIGSVIVEQVYKAISNSNIFERAAEEIEFITKYNIKPYFFLDENYPYRLSNCEDAPIIFYMMGEVDFNQNKLLSIVGTRNPSAYGKKICQKIIEDLANHPDIIIVSGLAYGIDITAHKAALDNNLKTIAVLAHGLDMIYPSIHSSTAKNIINSGCILSEFMSKQQPERPSFVKRNRIIAGLSDATLVIEAGLRSGALITADIANSYNRDVMAVPGRIGEDKTQGPHFLIKSNRAALIESASDIENYLNWKSSKKEKPKQLNLFENLNDDEKKIFQLLKTEGDLNIDILSRKSLFTVSRLSTILLNMEFQGIIECLPGKVFRLNL